MGIESARQVPRPLLYGVLGAVFVWMAFPPLGWSWLAFLAPIPWLRLIQAADWSTNRPYRALYIAGFLQWMLWIQWIRLPHWMTYFGWGVLSAYLAIYLPLFVGISRVLVHRLGWSLMIVAPVVWTALELVRGYLFTGFSLMLIGHTQVGSTGLIQIADFGGAYAVSFFVLLIASCVLTAITRPRSERYIAPAVALLVSFAIWAYGNGRLAQLKELDDAQSNTSHLRVGLIQGSVDTKFDDPQDPDVTFARYVEITRELLRTQGRVDVIVWPESMCTRPWIEVEEEFAIPKDVPASESPESFRRRMVEMSASCRAGVGLMARDFEAAVLLGCSTYAFGKQDLNRYNSVIAADAEGKVLARYDKMHPVMFGEYIPLGTVFPWLYTLSPMGEGLTAGEMAVSIPVGGLKFCPCICFENTVPHLIRQQVASLKSKAQMPDVLVTATNDGWFWGSSLLDVHLACGVFRAVEMRLPMLIAANTGFSAWIDAAGRIRAQGPRRSEGHLVANVAPMPPIARPYLSIGDLFAMGCLAVVVIGLLLARTMNNAGPWRETPPRA
jgi:apolipoprotein N-acyltransferase